MAGLSLRDRFFTPPVARAVTSPLGIVALGAGASIGILLGGGVAGAVILGLLGWGGRVAAAIPRAPAEARIDPFTLADPWRRYVTDALQARARFADAVGSAREGPMRDRLLEIQSRVDTGLQEVWRIARRGHDLVDARRRVDPDAIRRDLATTEANAGQPAATPQRSPRRGGRPHDRALRAGPRRDRAGRTRRRRRPDGGRDGGAALGHRG